MVSSFSLYLFAQSIDERYHTYPSFSPIPVPTNNIADAETLDYCLTAKYDALGYVAISAVYDNPSTYADQWCLKLVEFDNNGIIQLSGISKYIYAVPAQSTNLKSLKIITLEANQGYVITGFYQNNTSTCPYPFVIQLDINYNVNAQHVYSTCGYFTDVDQIPGGGFIFSGSWSSTINNVATRRGALMRTDNNFSPIYSRSIFHLTPAISTIAFDIIHDLCIIDDDQAYVTGAYSDECGSLPYEVSGHLLFGEVDLSTGNFNWTANIMQNIGSNFKHAIGSRVIFNDNYIAVAANSENPSSSSILFFDKATNAFTSGYYIENSTTALPNGSGRLLTHMPFIQNIYFIDNETVFFSCKQIGIQFNGNSANHYEIPSSGEVDVNGNVANGKVFITDQHYSGILPEFTSYYGRTDACGLQYMPFYASSNTIPVNGTSTGFITITHDKLDLMGNKTWIFTHDPNVCGYVELELFNVGSVVPQPQVSLDNIMMANPDKLDVVTWQRALDRMEYDCDEDLN
jgi:hypothetical protein